MEEDTVTPFVSESKRGDLLSSEDSELSEGEDEMIAPVAMHPKLKKEIDAFLKVSTENPLEHEKRKKLMACFPLPAGDAAHPLKMDKDITARIPKSAAIYDRLLQRSSNSTWTLWAHS